jgi:hypothetical protein
MIREHAVALCSRISEIFESVTGARCHTSIKSFNPDSGLVATRARDALMHNKDRAQTDEALESFLFEKNTAFLKILQDPNSYMFISNWLRLQAVFGWYINHNSDWCSYYGATVVMPITLHRNKVMIKPETVIGFICVDTLTGSFNKRMSRAILLLFVAMLHSMMVLLGAIPATGAADA